MKPSTITVGIVGLGRAGWGIHAETLRRDPRFQIVAVADPEADRVHQAVNELGCRGYDRIESLLQHERPELIIIASPSVHHAQEARMVFAAGAHCVLEKPLAISHPEALSIVKAAGDRHLFAYYPYRFRDEYHHMREVLEEGCLGEFFQLQAFWVQYLRRWDWQTLRKNGGGQLRNICSHVLSIVLPLLQEPVQSVAASLRNVKDAGDAEDHVTLQLQTQNRTASVVVSTACALPGTKWMLLGRHGTLSSGGETSVLRYLDPAKLQQINVCDGAAPERRYWREDLPWKEESRPTKPRQPVTPFYDNVFSVLRESGQLLLSPQEALEVTRVVDLAEEGAHRELGIYEILS